MPLHKDIIDRANARLGSVLNGKWRLDAVIGVGGMACVYAATHRNQARAAIKLLHREVALDTEVTARFLREGYVANAVGHPGTVTVLDDDVTEDNAPFLVMELLTGQTLETMLALAPDGLAAEEVLSLLDQLLDVLAAAHDKGIVHRDVKPENLFLTSDGRLKVLDFGIARLRELTVLGPSSTQAGSVLGTPAFMAPEQALGRWHEVDGRTDIWAVGATGFTLLSGQFVHEAETVQEQLVLSATRPARPVRHANPQVPGELARVLDRALAFERCDRFAHAREMRGALRQAAGQSPRAPLTPASCPFPQSAIVSSPADQHGATLVAPVEVTSAITGRSQRATTGHPVTHPTLLSARPGHGTGRRALALLGLALLSVPVALALGQWRRRGGPPPHLTALAPQQSAALNAVLPAVLPAVSTGLPVLPTSDQADAKAVASAVPAKKSVRLERRPPLTPPAPAATVKPTSESRLGEGNPFDRRH